MSSAGSGPVGWGSTMAAMTSRLLAALALLPAAAAPPALDGDYDSPLGRVRVSAEGDGYRGTLAAPSALCPFRAGEEVLRATLLDDSLAGQLRVCLRGERCAASEEWASVLLLATPAALSGAVHVSTKGCTGPFGKRGGVTLARAGGERPAARAAAGTAARSAGQRRERARALLREGKAWLDEGAFERARARFLAAAAAAPEVPAAYNGVGVTYRMRNDLPEALAWYKKALAADPDFGDAYYNMACVYALQGRAEMALRYLQMAALNGYTTGDGLDADPDLEPLRSHPGYRALRARM